MFDALAIIRGRDQWPVTSGSANRNKLPENKQKYLVQTALGEFPPHLSVCKIR